ncbi:MAG: isoprenyl transferase [Gammaproteobacteria bacterium]
MKPKHIAIIMDGNGRWAKQKFLPRLAGHRAGVEAVRRVIESCNEEGIAILTLFAFSSENWQRPKEEVSGLLDLFIRALQKELTKLHKNEIKICFLGDRSPFSEELQDCLLEAEKLTQANTKLRLNIATNYGGRWDITNAVKSIAKQVLSGVLTADKISEEVVAQYLALSDCPEPDLLIRTSGEQRISNFLLWQLAYTELYFTDILWPDFSHKDLQDALTYYKKRERRFGKIES